MARGAPTELDQSTKTGDNPVIYVLKGQVPRVGSIREVQSETGGDQLDRTMYEDLSAPTAATANVFAMAALAARERRTVATVDIWGAYLNASMVESGVIVHMRLDKVMTEILVKINPKFTEFVTVV